MPVGCCLHLRQAYLKEVNAPGSCDAAVFKYVAFHSLQAKLLCACVSLLLAQKSRYCIGRGRLRLDAMVPIYASVRYPEGVLLLQAWILQPVRMRDTLLHRPYSAGKTSLLCINIFDHLMVFKAVIPGKGYTGERFTQAHVQTHQWPGQNQQ